MQSSLRSWTLVKHQTSRSGETPSDRAGDYSDADKGNSRLEPGAAAADSLQFAICKFSQRFIHGFPSVVAITLSASCL
jgi:hypothetical protein